MLKLKNKSSAKQMSSFFIEIILVLFFFAIACAILIQVFIASYNNNKKAERLNIAHNSADYFCEIYSTTGDFEKASSLAFGYSPDENEYTYENISAYFNKIIAKQDVEKSSFGELKSANIQLFYGDEMLCEMNTSFYQIKEVENE